MRRKEEMQKRYKELRESIYEMEWFRIRPGCRLCTYYQPGFRYRRCLLAACPYGKGQEAVFRKKPSGGR